MMLDICFLDGFVLDLEVRDENKMQIERTPVTISSGPSQSSNVIFDGY